MSMASMEAKQAELAQLKAIESMSSDLVVQLESISDNFETLADGTKVVADVLGRWNELLKVMAARDTQMILMPQAGTAAPQAGAPAEPTDAKQ